MTNLEVNRYDDDVGMGEGRYQEGRGISGGGWGQGAYQEGKGDIRRGRGYQEGKGHIRRGRGYQEGEGISGGGGG